ncbi:MAG: PD-(D/E)XK nuclease family protein, partial [Vicinamibacterales bacterium]
RRLRTQPADRTPPDPATSPLAFLMNPDRARGARADLFHAGGREAEIEEVFRRILKAGVSLDQVEIVCASEAAAQLTWEKALRLDWPVTIAPGVPAVRTRPGRALLAFCDWIESHFTSSHLRRFLQSGDLRLEDVGDLTSGQAARLLAKAEAAWGRATYGLALTRLQKGYERAAGNSDLSDETRAASATKAIRVASFRRWVQMLLDAIPPEDGSRQVPLDSVIAAALMFLERCTARSSALDGAAAKGVAESIAELSALGTFSCSLATALRFIRERVEGTRVGSDRARPGHLHVATVSQFGASGRPLLFIVGLEEGRVFPAAIEDPVLLDNERMSISSALRLSKDKVDEAVWSALSHLATHGGATVFSYSSRDLREYRETYASWLVLQAFRVKHENGGKSYRDLHDELGEAKSCVPEIRDEATTDTGWWLSSVKEAGAPVVPALLGHFPAIAQGRAADTQRAAAAFTVFDGYVPEAGKVLDPCANPTGVSPTALEGAAECGFRYFLQRGLRLDAIDEGERDGDVWLDALVRGSELHDLYAASLRRCRDAGRRPDIKIDLSWLLNRARDRLAVLQVELPPPSDEVFDRESRDFLADLELFLAEECDAPKGRTPIGLEVAFGRTRGDDADGQAEPLSNKEPVEIDLGRGLKFRLAGRIDRIDQIGEDSFEIIDYKTGGYWEDKWAKGVFAGGTRLQHALYGLAVAELLRRKKLTGSVTAGVYYFSSAKGGKERRIIPAPSKTDVAGVLGDLRGMIASGTFLHAADHGACTYCDYFRACGAPVAVKRAEEKLADPKLNSRNAMAGRE